MNTKKQSGSIGVLEIGLLALVILVAFPVAIALDAREAGKAEISPQAYSQLLAVATQSCAGPSYLKDRVQLGPILVADFGAVRAELETRAKSSKTNDAKRAITGLNTVCTG